MKSKFKVFLTDKVYAVLSLDISIPTQQADLAETLGIDREEQNNLVGQKMQEFLYLLGNTEEA